MPINQNSNLRSALPEHLKGQLSIIENAVGSFWTRNVHHNHFTLHGLDHSEYIETILSQLIQGLPSEQSLNDHERFILVACAYLYEIGMQSLNIKPILGFDKSVDRQLTFSQKQIVRKNRHTLTADLIQRSLKDNNPNISLGLSSLDEEYKRIIAIVCGNCSKEKLETVHPIEYFENAPIRVKLLTALLQLADQLCIHKRRIQVEQIEGNMPTLELVKWRVFEYVNFKPVIDGKIGFRYSIQEDQQTLLDYIRPLIEQEFSFDQNPAMQTLGRDFHLSIWPPKPDDETDKTIVSNSEAIRLKVMSSEYVSFLRRNVTPFADGRPSNDNQQAILIVDVIKLQMQLLRDGYPCSLDFLGRLMVKVRAQAASKASKVSYWAIAPWNRPDLKDIEAVFRQRAFGMINLEEGEGASQKITDEIRDQLNLGSLPGEIILVAPSENLAPFIQELTDQKYAVDTWINHVEEARIYEGNAFGQDSRYLDQLLGLDGGEPLSLNEYYVLQEILILALDHEMRTQEIGALDFAKIKELFNQVCESDEKGLWWLLLLINNKSIGYSNQTYFLNKENDLVVKTLRKFNIIEKSFKSLSQDKDGIREDALLKDLRVRDNVLFKNEDSTLSILNLLRMEEILRKKSAYDELESPTYWQINLEHLLFRDIEAYLPRFVIALDQVMLRLGVHEHHHHTLTKHLANYLGNDLIEKIYSKATLKKWVRVKATREPLKKGDGFLSFVSLAEDNPDVIKTLRNRAILLNFFLKGNQMYSDFLPYELWERLCQQTASFNLPSEEFLAWVKIFIVDNVLLETEEVLGTRKVKLNLESKIVQGLYARLYLPELVRSMRRLRATSTEEKKNRANVVEKLVSWNSSCSTLVATWTIDHAQRIGLIFADEGNEAIWLYRQHGYINMLDRKEAVKEQRLIQLVNKINRDGDGWVPKAVVISEMDKSLEFGCSRQEQEYWLGQAVYRTHNLMQERRADRRGREQMHLRVASK